MGGGGCDTWMWRKYGWKLDKIDERCQLTYSRNSTNSDINSVSYLAHHNHTFTSKYQKVSKAAKESNPEEGIFNKTNRWFLIRKHGVPKDDILKSLKKNTVTKIIYRKTVPQKWRS